MVLPALPPEPRVVREAPPRATHFGTCHAVPPLRVPFLRSALRTGREIPCPSIAAVQTSVDDPHRSPKDPKKCPKSTPSPPAVTSHGSARDVIAIAPQLRELRGPLSGYQRVRLPIGPIAGTLLAIVPSMAAIAAGSPQIAAYWFFAAFFGVLLAQTLTGHNIAALALTVGVVPTLMLLRNLVWYNSVLAVLLFGVGAIILRSRANSRILARAGFPFLLYIGALYWLVSYIITGDYSSNLRILELAMMAAVVVLLTQHPAYLASGLYSALLTLLITGIAFYPYGDRLGYATIGGVRLGNPIAFGLPLALLFILLFADLGKWLLLQQSPAIRIALSVLVGGLLFLSTSRGSWLVAGGAIILTAVLHRRDRRAMIVGLALMVFAGGALLQSKRGADLATWLDRTFSDERSLTNKTSGRSDQWMLLPLVMRDEPPWGFGPGTGAHVYGKYSLLDPRVKLLPGHNVAWHSLYLQVVVEAGVIGVGVLSLLCLLLTRSAIKTYRTKDQVTPLVGAVSFLLIALTVSGMDAASGLFLGFAMCGPTLPDRKRLPGEQPGEDELESTSTALAPLVVTGSPAPLASRGRYDR